MSSDDGVGAHRAVLDAGEVHRAALSPHEPAFATHQLAEDADHRRAAGERVGVAAIGAEGVVVLPHRHREAGGDRFLAEREMARALHEVLQEEIIGALLQHADLD